MYQVTSSGKVAGTSTVTTSNGGRIGDLLEFTLTPANSPKQIIAPDGIGGAAYVNAVAERHLRFEHHRRFGESFGHRTQRSAEEVARPAPSGSLLEARGCGKGMAIAAVPFCSLPALEGRNGQNANRLAAMRSLSKSAVFIGILTLAAGGCTSSSSSLPTLTPPLASAQAQHQRQSWMLREASGEDLLYIADAGLGGIAVYSYTPPKYRLVGILTTPSNAFLCVNKAQTIFATAGHTIIKYKHGATSPAVILGGIPGYAGTCAVDLSTGTVAVTNGTGYPLGISEVSFFKKAHKRSTTITLPQPYALGLYCAYDGSGNLFVGAHTGNSGSHFVLLELPRNKRAIRSDLAGFKSLAIITRAAVWRGTENTSTLQTATETLCIGLA